MATQRDSGMLVAPWANCDVCGDTFRVTDLKRQKGVLKCPFDFDDTIVETRDAIIDSVLSSNEEEPRTADILRDPGEDDDDYLW